MTQGPGRSVSSEEFAALDEQEQVVRLQKLAALALAAWNLNAPRLEPIKYRENAVFAMNDDDGHRGVVRVHRPHYRSDLDIRCELAWMQALHEKGIATPNAIPAVGGELVWTASAPGVPEARQCDLLQWVDGAPPGTLEGGISASGDALRELYRSVGSLAARMHVLVAEWQRPVPFSRPSWNVETLVGESPTFGRFWELDEISAEQRSVLFSARDVVRERLTALGPADALIHGDLVPDNILIDGPVQRIIDFDDFGWSWIGFEMTTSLFPLQISGGFDAGLQGYLEGYRSIRPFPDEQLEALRDMLLARGLSYLGWAAGRPEVASQRLLVPMFAAMLSDDAANYLASRR